MGGELHGSNAFANMISVSIVSHRQISLLMPLVDQLCAIENISQIIITINTPEPIPAISKENQSRILFIYNEKPKGFGANHNSAFAHCNSPFFCVLNPDIRLLTNPFPTLLESIIKTGAAMGAPQVVNSLDEIEDSIRLFPSPWSILKRVLIGKHNSFKFADNQKIFYPNWVAGMFMLFDSSAYRELNGFDDRYFLYYEDVDICARIWKNHMRLLVNQEVKVIHDAQRSSHANLKFLRWHIESMCLFFLQHMGRLPKPDLITGHLV